MRKNKYTFFGVFKTWTQLLGQTALQWRVFGVYAAIMTIVDALFGHWSYSCRGDEIGFWCVTLPDNRYMVIAAMCVFYLLFTYLICAFTTDLHNSLFKNSVFKSRDVFIVSKQKLNTTLVLAGWFLIATISLVVAYYLIQRPANPDFQVEFGYFLIVFVLLLLPLMMIRCATCFAYYLNTGNFELRKVYDHTSGRSYISVMLFLLLAIMLLVINIHAFGFFSRISREYNSFTTALTTDFADNLLKLLSVTVFYLFAEAQCIRMEETENLRKETVVAESEADAAKITSADAQTEAKMSVKSAKKKKNQRKLSKVSAPKTKRKSSK